MLADPRSDSDTLLRLTDALEEAAEEALTVGRPALARDLRALADEARALAPDRVLDGLPMAAGEAKGDRERGGRLQRQ
jgi:hypothetical protein